MHCHGAFTANEVDPNKGMTIYFCTNLHLNRKQINKLIVLSIGRYSVLTTTPHHLKINII